MAKKRGKTGKSVYDVVYSRLSSILKGLETVDEWKMPWTQVGIGKGPRNPYSAHRNGEIARSFNGSNNWMLMFDTLLHDLKVGRGEIDGPAWGDCPYFSGPKQIANAGGNLSTAARSSMIMQPLFRPIFEEIDGEKVKTGRYLSGFRFTRVFNLTQTDLDWRAILETERETVAHLLHDHSPIDAAQAVWDNCPNKPAFTIDVGCDQAFYSPLEDRIEAPHISQYAVPEEYYHTLYHELGHSIKHPSRLGDGQARQRVKDAPGRVQYALEEIIAESMAYRLCTEVGIADKVESGMLAYLKHWVTQGQHEDPEVLFLAFAEADARADFVLQPVAEVV